MNTFRLSRLAFVIFSSFVFLTACNSGGSSRAVLNASVTGLASGEQVELNLYLNGNTSAFNSRTTITGTDAATVTAAVSSSISGSYLVRVSTVPSGKTCTVEHSSADNIDAFGTISSGTQTVYVVCSATAHAVSGMVTGLASGNTVNFVINGDLATSVTADGAFTVDGALADQARYEVTYTDLSGNQRCVSTADTGTATGDVTLEITCNYVNSFYVSKVSSNVVRGDFGATTDPRTYADDYCQQLLEDEYADFLSCDDVVAFISVNENDEIRDIPDLHTAMNPSLEVFTRDSTTPTSVFYAEEQYNSKLSDDWSGLLDGSVDSDYLNATFWTGSDSAGELSGSACDSWTSISGDTGASLGAQNTFLSAQGSCSYSFQIPCLCLQDQEVVTTLNYLFPTTETMQGDFGDRATADAICQTTHDSDYSELNCDGVAAFVSYSASDEVRDFPTTYGLNTSFEIQDASNDFTKIADNWDDLLDGSIDNALNVNWWSGTLIDSTTNDGSDSGFNCSSWTSNAAVDATVGHTSETSDFWAGTSDGMCDESHHLMCLCYQE